MKKLLLVICLLPFVGFAQTIIKTIQFPNIPVDSLTNMRTYRANVPVEGADKGKLAGALYKWTASNFTTADGAPQAAGDGAMKINGEGYLPGSYAVQHLTAFQSAPDKLKVNAPAVDFKIKFNVEITVVEGGYNIALSNFKIDVFNTITPLEQYYRRNFPLIIIPDEDRGMDISDMYSHIFQDVDSNIRRLVSSASKYVAKAKKKGEV